MLQNWDMDVVMRFVIKVIKFWFLMIELGLL